MLHVDVVAIDVRRSMQTRVGVVVATDHGVIEEDVDPAYVDIISSVLDDCAGLSAERALEAAAVALAGTYSTATSPHDERDCPFASGTEIPLETGHFGNVPLAL